MKKREIGLGIFSLMNLLIIVVCPIIVGALIYTLWRSPSLLVFSWYQTFNLTWFVKLMRDSAASTFDKLPYWFLFSFPDGLWVFAITAFMGGLWIGTKPLNFWFWSSIGIALAVGAEIGQLFRIIQGTFDVRDIIFYFLGYAFALITICLYNQILVARNKLRIEPQ